MSAVLVTGASGFIGRALVRTLAHRQRQALCLARMLPDGKRWHLGDPLSDAHLAQVSSAIHLAWDTRHPETSQASANATLALARQLADAGVGRQIFISSASAGPHAVSAYGRAKYQVEQGLTAIPGCISVRPGLVIGDGGLFGRIARFARLSPVVPLPDGGRGRVAVIGVEDLAARLLALIDHPRPPGLAAMAEPGSRSLRELVQAAAGPRVVLPIPSRPLLALLALAGALRLPLPVTRDNLAGFLANQPLLSSDIEEFSHDHSHPQTAP